MRGAPGAPPITNLDFAENQEADNETEHDDRFGQCHEDQDVREQFGLLSQGTRATSAN